MSDEKANTSSINKESATAAKTKDPSETNSTTSSSTSTDASSSITATSTAAAATTPSTNATTNNTNNASSSSQSSPASISGDDDSNRTPDYQKLVDYGLQPKVAKRLDDIYKTGKLSHSDLDDRALDALNEFPPEGAIAVLTQFLESNLEHVSNKSAYLCGVMKTYRQKNRAGMPGIPGSIGSNAAGDGGNGGSDSGANGINGEIVHRGPDETKIKAILERTGYKLDVTTGQRKFGGPPPDWEGPVPGQGCEVFCGKIPRDLYEDELIPLFEKCGVIWDLRLMMDPMTGLNRGYAFITYTTREGALEAVRQLDSYDLGDGKTLKVNVSEPKTRLFVGNIPKSKNKADIVNEFQQFTANLREVIIYSSPDDKKKNRGFCFLEYESHKAASLAKRRLETGRVKVWSCDIIVDWADPQEEPDDDTMSQVKVLYVRNLKSNATEEKLRETFENFGMVERVKKIKDYAFVHFENREHGLKAMETLNGREFCGSNLEISLAKPPSDKKKKEEMLRKREQRMMKQIIHCAAFPSYNPFPTPYGHMGGPGMYPSMGGVGVGANRGGRGGMRGGGGGSGAGGDLHRGFENAGGWNWAWGDAGWPQQPRGNGPPINPWMGAASESWSHPGGGGGGRGYPPGNSGYPGSAGGNGMGGANMAAGPSGGGGGGGGGGNRGGRQQRSGGYTR